jgi:hypothetical protein
VCSLLSLIPYPKHVHFASLALAAEYWESGGHTHLAPEQDHNRTPDSVTLPLQGGTLPGSVALPPWTRPPSYGD